jgi:hypothetical protein
MEFTYESLKKFCEFYFTCFSSHAGVLVLAGLLLG